MRKFKFKKPVSENKKVKNAKETIIDGIKFKSEFESKCYLLLKSSKLNFQYESEQCVLVPGFKDSGIFMWKGVRKKVDGKNKLIDFVRKPMNAMRDWTYTPDFVIYSKDLNTKIYVECKGNPTDLTPYKTKMFLRYLSSLRSHNGKQYEYAFVTTMEEMRRLISDLNNNELFV